MSIGERISSLRKEAGLSQGQLAAMMNVSRQAVSKWENELASPDTLKMIQLADALRTDVDYLATGIHSDAQPRVEKTVEIKERIVEKIVEVPVERIVEKPVQVIVEKKVPLYIDREVEKPVLQRVVRYKYTRNPIEYIVVGIFSFLLGLAIGIFLL